MSDRPRFLKGRSSDAADGRARRPRRRHSRTRARRRRARVCVCACVLSRVRDVLDGGGGDDNDATDRGCAARLARARGAGARAASIDERCAREGAEFARRARERGKWGVD